MQPDAPLDPQGFMQWLAARPAQKGTSVECGAGLGELSAFLNTIFRKSIATDLSPPPSCHTHIDVLCGAAEDIPAGDHSIDLLLSMQALHFFDVQQHLREARRLLRPGGVFAALSWGEISLPPAIEAAYRPVIETIAPYWESQRGWAVSGYAGLQFPGTRLKIPLAALRRPMTLPGLDAEIARWSAVQKAITAGVPLPEPDLDQILLPDDEIFDVAWPVGGQVFQVQVFQGQGQG